MNGGAMPIPADAPSRVLVLPQRDGRLLLLSQEKPQALLDASRSAHN